MSAVRWLAVLVLAAGAATLAWSFRDTTTTRDLPADVSTTMVTRGELSVLSAHDGVIESRHMVSVASRFQGPATLVELVEEGATVAPGDVLARFDASEIRARIMKLEQELAIARSELESLEHARLPLELKELELALDESRRKRDAERAYLDDSEALMRDRMLSAQEVEQQRRKVASLDAEVDKVELEYRLTRDYLHPAALAKARTTVASAEQSLAVAREQLASSVIRAPAGGVVVYKPLGIGNEFRRVRVGDTLYPNQPFMILPDMSDLVAVLDVPEAELNTVAQGAPALVQPLAYSDLRFDGHVETVGAVAQSVPGKPDRQKFFHVVVRIETNDPRIRPGMSVVVQVQSYFAEDAVLVPRRAVRFGGGEPRARVLVDGTPEWREVSVGRANLTHYEVVAGLAPGDRVVVD